MKVHNLSGLTKSQKVLKVIGKPNLVILKEYLEIERDEVRKGFETCEEEAFKIFRGKILEIKSIERDIKAIEVS